MKRPFLILLFLLAFIGPAYAGENGNPYDMDYDDVPYYEPTDGDGLACRQQCDLIDATCTQTKNVHICKREKLMCYYSCSNVHGGSAGYKKLWL